MQREVVEVQNKEKKLKWRQYSRGEKEREHLSFSSVG